MCPIIRCLLILFTWFVLTASPGNADVGTWNTVGFRSGASDTRNDETFIQNEAYVTLSLPWKWKTSADWIVGSFVGINAGVLSCKGDSFVGSIGPGVYIQSPDESVSLSAGIYPTYIGQSSFGKEDLGGNFQFTSAAGIDFHLYRRWSVGYRFQHISNGGLYDQNPGINNHMIEVGCRF